MFHNKTVSISAAFCPNFLQKLLAESDMQDTEYQLVMSQLNVATSQKLTQQTNLERIRKLDIH